MAYIIEGLVDGQWSASHVGPTDESVSFETREEAADGVLELAKALDCPEEDLRIVEID